MGTGGRQDPLFDGCTVHAQGWRRTAASAVASSVGGREWGARAAAARRPGPELPRRSRRQPYRAVRREGGGGATLRGQPSGFGSPRLRSQQPALLTR